MRKLRGIMPVLLSTFDDADDLYLPDLEAQAEFCVASGAHGLVWPGAVSEFFTLETDEICEGLGAIRQVANDRVPIIAGVTASSTRATATRASAAQASGASAVMSMLPPVSHLFAPDTAFAVEHFSRIADSVSVPIILQNARMGFPMSIGQVREVVETVPGIRYVKEETAPNTHKLSASVDAMSTRVDGVFGGIGSIYLVSELMRGAGGSMPAPPFTDVIVVAYEAFCSGEVQRCRSLIADLAPAFNYELLYNFPVLKEILKRRGVIELTTSRAPGPRLDEVDMDELDQVMSRIQPLLERVEGQ